MTKRNSDSPSHPDNSEVTRTDLGDDLLESTASISVPKSAFKPGARAVDPVGPVDPVYFDDQLQSAKILMNEGLLEEAKKVLRHILVRDPRNTPAHLALREIHETELKQIFNDDDDERRRRLRYRQDDASRTGLDEPPPVSSAQQVMRELDRDLKLGLLSEDGEELQTARFSLFQDKQGMEAFARELDQELAGMGGRDRIDLGIGFLEMSFYELAARQFRAAFQQCAQQEVQDKRLLIGATSLLGYALILSGHGFEASQAIQATLRDSEIQPPDKLELFYLMGRSHELMGRREIALQWYEKTQAIDPVYRDVAERLHGLAER